jgi:hypothetical protein
MYLDTGTLLAICIAMGSQLVMMVMLFRSAYQWEQAYHSLNRKFKIERTARVSD